MTERLQKLDYREIIASLNQKLPEMSKKIISDNLDLTDSTNQQFHADPDSVEFHEPNWHQWGVITHTMNVERCFQEEMPGYLSKWGVEEAVKSQMEREIDGRSREELLAISLTLHDLGKFAARKTVGEPGNLGVSFKYHENDSADIISNPEFITFLQKEYGLTIDQIDYLAECVRRHFILGVVREEAKASDLGYTMAYTNGEQFQSRVEGIIEANPGYETEIGLMFLVDSLGKTDIRITAVDDTAIEAQTEQITEQISSRGLNPNLIRSIKQLPVNIEIARRYLEQATEHKQDL